ncbi:MAG: hypothetical protein APF80_09265 [Alphaproteobacteria bacterium BRH_c36]|nr:MAG: hypothetical protein APF80_09265 [Alphaproteobacteria bacterium BRH_c36]
MARSNGGARRLTAGVPATAFLLLAGMAAAKHDPSQSPHVHQDHGHAEAGAAMHRAVSRFAVKAQNASVTGYVRPALGVLSERMSACVACHAEFRRGAPLRKKGFKARLLQYGCSKWQAAGLSVDPFPSS